ncbi:hypothetical protein [Conexibacter sp. SYSU D00693]|uniref:hypothetical protein n=1 Tax=Conexibacter sp. SYSU D00693 TaxID=2812560 RepID=UPI00196BAC8D|nr:hypothetical protein [Conexibacter sp. SYSU D00693]
MDEVLPGLLHWPTFHDGIGQVVHSHLHVASGAIFDPRLPEGGVAGLEHAGIPSVVLLSNRHHLRHSAEVAEAFGCPIRCHEAGLHEFEGDEAPQVEGFAWGDEVAAGVRAVELGVLCPEETVFHIDAGPGVLLFADAVVRWEGELAFVPDDLLGDDPEAIKAGIKEHLGRIAQDEEFDALLFAHGEPMPTGGREALQAFAAG